MSPKLPATFSWHDAASLKHARRFDLLPDIRSILVTGGAGFIGSWVTRHLAMLYPEYKFVCFDSLDHGSSLNNIRILDDSPNFTFVRGSITDASAVGRCLMQHRVDAILHFAAQSHVDLSFDSPHAFCETNINGTTVLLEAARKRNHNIKRFIHVSTDEVYGEIPPGGTDHKESDPLCPTNPYSGSKAGAEMMVCAYSKSFDVPTIIVRSNNVYGPNQFPEKIIPKFSSLLMRGEKVPLYGSGEYTRRYVYASDAAEAFNVILHRGAVGEVYNIGSRDQLSNKEVLARIIRTMRETVGKGGAPPSISMSPPGDLEVARWMQLTPNRPFMDREYGVDCSKLRSLGWTQKVGIDEGFRRTVEWYCEFGREWWGDISPYILDVGAFNKSLLTEEVAGNGHEVVHVSA